MQTLPETVNSLPTIDLSKSSRQQIKEYFLNSYALYETLFKSIIDKEENWKINPDPLRRPILWYLGHTAALYINKLVFSRMSGPVNENYEKLFKTGVDPIYAEELDNDTYRQYLPRASEVWKYRDQVREKVLEVIDNTEINYPIRDTDPIYTVILGIEHERIHYETSVCLIRQMPVETLQKPISWKYAPMDTQNFPKNEFIEVQGQTVQFGKQKDFPTYGWDNEYGDLKLELHPFKASKYLISNGEYLQFVLSGGYQTQQFWDHEGWNWIQLTKMKHPLYWVQTGEQEFKYRALFDIIDMPLNWPVDVSAHEARAYCRWKGDNFRLISEGEYNIIKGENISPNFRQNIKEADIGAFDTEAGNTQLKYGSSCPVDSQRPSPLGFYDCYGNVWEWSQETYKPLPGFETNQLYPDFSGGCFDWNHSMMFGGSWASTGAVSSSFGRYAFRRHFYQCCGFRIVEHIQDNHQQEMYVDKVYLNRYLHFNFATNEEFFPIKSRTFDLSNYESYPVVIANEALKFFERVKKETHPEIQSQEQIYENTHAMDLGCGMGRTAFELARKFSRVTGLDYAHGFIDVANELKQNGKKPYQYLKTGDIYIDAVAEIHPDIERERVDFLQADAMNLPSLMGPYDLIVASNLIDRLYNPIQCLITLQPMLKYDGTLIITSPYTWMENVASKDKWIGAKDGQTTFEALKDVMKTLCFELVEEQTMTLMIKEHERKYEFIMPHMTIWKKRPFSQEFATSVFRETNKY